jgi:hypothetical protein
MTIHPRNPDTVHRDCRALLQRGRSGHSVGGGVRRLPSCDRLIAAAIGALHEHAKDDLEYLLAMVERLTSARC